MGRFVAVLLLSQLVTHCGWILAFGVEGLWAVPPYLIVVFGGGVLIGMLIDWCQENWSKQP